MYLQYFKLLFKISENIKLVKINENKYVILMIYNKF